MSTNKGEETIENEEVKLKIEEEKEEMNFIKPKDSSDYRKFEDEGESLNEEKEVKSTVAIVREKCYNFFEKPDSSILARLFTIFITFLILISIVCLCVQSLGYFKHENGETKYVWIWMIVEGVIALCFTVEFILRFFVIVKSLKSLWGFVKNLWNFIDLLAFLPFWIEMLLYVLFGVKFNIEYLGIFRALRMLRLFQFWKPTRKVSNLFLAIKKSLFLLIAFVCLLFTGIIIFSTIVYHFEKGKYDEVTKKMLMNGKETKFTSIPQTFWWSVVTLSTLGYGDMVPYSFFGQFFGGLYIIISLMALSLPSLNKIELGEESKEEKEEKEKELSETNPLLNLSFGDENEAFDYKEMSIDNLVEVIEEKEKKTEQTLKEISKLYKENLQTRMLLKSILFHIRNKSK